MREILEKQLDITPGFADCTGRLGIYETFRALMDMAAIHAEELGVGFEAMARRDTFWLTVKTQVNFIERPKMPETVTLRTWPEMPEKVRANRSYEVIFGRTLITGKTEWAVINTKTHRLVPMRGVFPEELRFEKPTSCPEPFGHIEDSFSEGDRVDEYRVRSVDIDVGGHMNNAAYIKALMGSFSNGELMDMDIKKVEAIFKSPCFEGDKLMIYRRRTEKGFAIKMARGEETVLLAGIE